MVWCVNYSSLEAVDWSLYKFGGEGDKKGTALKKLGQKIYIINQRWQL